MTFEPLPLAGAFLITLGTIGDDRGWFSRTFCKDVFQENGLATDWVQSNHTYTSLKGTIRGMHFQYPPYSETKLVRCISGSVLDVIIDLRSGSKTFLNAFAAELTSGNKKMMYVPKGFAHGFQTLTNDVEMVYSHSDPYNKAFEGGIRYNDAAIHIDWPLAATELSERDISHPLIDINLFNGI